MNLQLLIAGGGIAGLAAALAVARTGADARVFERSRAPSEIGAGVQLGPNATRVMHGWGLQHALASFAAFPDAVVARSALTGRNLARLPLDTRFERRYGAPYVTLHRADLLGLLQRAAGLQPGVHLRMDTAIVGHVQTGPVVTVRTAEGIEIEGDALLAADGLWSAVRGRTWGDAAPRASGHVAYRALIAQADLPAAMRANNVTAWLGPHMHAVQYPVRGGEWMNLVVIVALPPPAAGDAATENNNATQTRAGSASDASDRLRSAPSDEFLLPRASPWDVPAPLAPLQAAVAPLCSALQSLVAAVGSWSAWHLYDRPAVAGPDALVHGRIALVGDAGHPMLPYLAQGAGMAIEDAAELGRALALVRHEVRDVVDLPLALRRYALNRWQRVARVQHKAVRNGEIFHASGLRRVGRDVALRFAGAQLMNMPWLYGAPQ